MSWLRAPFSRTSLSYGLAYQSCPIRIRPQHVPRMRCYSEQKEPQQDRGSAQTSADSESVQSSSTGDSEQTASQEEKLVTELREKLKSKEVEVVDLAGRLRYSQADYQNLQRIAKKEKEQTQDFAITRFATDLLDTVDVLSLALRSIPAQYSSLQSPDPQKSRTSDIEEDKKSPEILLHELFTGVSLTNKQLLSTFSKYGITQFDPIGQKFDPNFHEAMYAVPLPGKEPSTVIETRKFGYMIKGRVLRAAQVGIVQEK